MCRITRSHRKNRSVAGVLRSHRSARGNMLALVTAILCLVLTLVLFMFGYIRLIGADSEQRTAIESAALAAAKELSRIIIEDENFGFVSLSDYAPTGKGTKAGDNYYLPAHSINTLLGTIRLDMLIAERINDPIMMDFADKDYNHAMKAKDNLIQALERTLHDGSAGLDVTARDLNGDHVNPHQSALAAYSANAVRMTGKSKYVAGSLKLSLGSLSGGGACNVPIPHPESFGQVHESQKLGQYYRSYVNVPLGEKDFVFGGIGKDVSLVDPSKVLETIADLPYQIPTIVRAEADQIVYIDGNEAKPQVRHATACAQPFSISDPVPAPGLLSISFPDGRPVEMMKPGDLMSVPQFLDPSKPSDLLTPIGGDYPGYGGVLTPLPWPIASGGSNPPISFIWSGSLYDWLRRGGTKTDIASVQSMMMTPFPATVASTKGQSNIYFINSNGTIGNAQTPIEPIPYMVMSEDQMLAISKGALISSEQIKYDVYIRDQVFQPGRTNGGGHAGEPLDNPVYAAAAGGGTSGGGTGGAGSGTSSWVPTSGTSVLGLIGIEGNPFGGGLFGLLPTSVCICPCPPCCSLITLCYGSTTPHIIAGPPDDFGQGMAPPPPQINFSTGPATGAMRPTYFTNGTAVDVRFRKSIPVLPVTGAIPLPGGPRYGVKNLP